MPLVQGFLHGRGNRPSQAGKHRDHAAPSPRIILMAS